MANYVTVSGDQKILHIFVSNCWIFTKFEYVLEETHLITSND